MPFIRYARDKRGYESTYVMHVYRPGQGAARTRVLYVFRSPAHLKVGRQPLDPEVMEALEHTHPDLSFDWNGLIVERDRERAGVERSDRPSREGYGRRDRPAGQSTRPAGVADRPPRPPAPEVPAAREDPSLLGRIAGADQAARLRGRYADVLQRVQQRARTPEDRARLIARAERLNPDDCQDEAAIKAFLQTAPAEWDAITGELPGRRRRRGGRDRGRAQPGDPAASAIMTEAPEGEGDADTHDVRAAGPDRPADGPDDGPGVGSDTDDPGPAGPESARAGAGLPVGREPRPDGREGL